MLLSSRTYDIRLSSITNESKNIIVFESSKQTAPRLNLKNKKHNQQVIFSMQKADNCFKVTFQ